MPMPSGALYWEAESTLIVADLHLEKGAAFAARGMMLPPYDTRPRAAWWRLAIPRFHRSELAGRLAADDREALAALQRGRDWYWVLGNHDPELPPCVGGTARLGGITLRHLPTEGGKAPEIAGHLHPVARIARRGEGIRRKCFATDGHRLVMPAFGAYTGGLNVLDDVFGALFLRHRLEAWMTGRSDVYPMQASMLLPD